MQPTKVLVVDDSAFMRKFISDLITADPQFVILDTAKNGQEAIDKVKTLQPDIVTMDIEMPVMDGLEALKVIMDENPTPVIMLSSFTENGAKETILALELGAFDFIQKPSGAISFDIHKIAEDLIERLKGAVSSKTRRGSTPPVKEAKPAESPIKTKVNPTSIQTNGVKKSTHEEVPLKTPVRKIVTKETKSQQALPKTLPKTKEVPKEPIVQPARPSVMAERVPDIPVQVLPPKIAKPAVCKRLVAIGTSTGGPRALKEVLTGLPKEFPAPIVIVQHMPANFTRSLAQRLDSFCEIRVVEAQDGERLEPGTAYVAPGGWHMTVERGKKGAYMARLEKTELRNGHRPSVDKLFESLLPLEELERHVVILTGMGSDGARAMKALSDSGVKSTFAESEETCVVYGMPRSAVELKCVKYILPIHDIAPQLLRVVK